ncbi:cytochrome c oxidase accessory protein CcoG [Salinarimonas sp.]|uniref:cytochrome c oxidase accessory protein CcoG n=1 Tax=Salinarimonas sp. TaxID=2766526 RepID=UPI0032D91169
MADTATPNSAQDTAQHADEIDETLIEGPLYAKREQLYVQKVDGTFRRIKWAVLVLTLGVYYLLPFVRWDRGPNAPDQAVLIDFPARRFYFFFIEIWPQEIYYLTGLLILAAFVLFLMNAVAGRVWCGYLCPQTVWTDLFLAVERFFEGDRRERIKLYNGGWTGNRVARTSGKHFVWLMIAWWTGGAWVLYFADAPKLVWELATLQAPAVAYIWIGILTFTTYTLAGFMREQVCTYMCPWPRIQAALTDEHALNVTYKVDRGEPRGSLKKAKALREHGVTAGDCIDCNQCVAVCPTGVDIRDGMQLGCVQCGLCIDACDGVMDKIGRPRGLIAYDSEYNLERREAGLPEEKPKIVRARTILYVVLIAGISLFMVWHLAVRSSLDVSALHDRNPVYVLLSDGSIRNAYTVRVANKELEERTFTLSVEGLEGVAMEAVGAENLDPDTLSVTVGPTRTRELRVLLTRTPAPDAPESREIAFVFETADGSEAAVARDHFIQPAR